MNDRAINNCEALNKGYQRILLLDEGRIKVELHLFEASSPYRFDVRGQLVGAKGTKRYIQLIPFDGRPVIKAKMNDNSTFILKNLESGEYRLVIYCDYNVFVEIVPFKL